MTKHLMSDALDADNDLAHVQEGDWIAGYNLCCSDDLAMSRSSLDQAKFDDKENRFYIRCTSGRHYLYSAGNWDNPQSFGYLSNLTQEARTLKQFCQPTGS